MIDFLIIFSGVSIILGIGFYLFSIYYAANQVIINTLKRNNKEQWSRTAEIEDPKQQEMDALGQSWKAEHLHLKTDVHIVRDGFNLYGEYYDLGFKRCAIILSGRTESLRYGFFFSEPYSSNGFNLLVIDPRAHGESDGEYNTVGFEESKDALAWAKFLHENFCVEEILFHGICIGAATGMLAITSPDCPDYIKGLVTEGMFINFGESMKNHLIERKKNWFPIMHAIDFWFKKYTKHTMLKGPIDYIHKMEKPLLMLQSKKDPYSTPENAQKLFDLCPSNNKTLVYFKEGGHSLLRITDMTKYDDSIGEFIKNNFN